MEMGKELKLSLKIEYQKDTDNIEITTNGQSNGITFPAKMFLPLYRHYFVSVWICKTKR